MTDGEREVLNHIIGKIKEFSLLLDDAQSDMHIWTLLFYLLSENCLRCQVAKLFRLSQNVAEFELSSLQTLAHMRFKTSNQIL